MSIIDESFEPEIMKEDSFLRNVKDKFNDLVSGGSSSQRKLTREQKEEIDSILNFIIKKYGVEFTMSLLRDMKNNAYYDRL